MSLTALIIILAVVIFVALLIIFPEFRALFKGFTRVFIKDIATTPEGAEAIYSEKINNAQDAYNKADNALRVAAGKLSNAKRDLENLRARQSKVEAECESFVKNGKVDMAQLKAEEREEILSDINRLTELVKAYEAATNTAKEAQEICEKNLRKLKRESKEVVENMKTKILISLIVILSLSFFLHDFFNIKNHSRKEKNIIIASNLSGDITENVVDSGDSSLLDDYDHQCVSRPKGHKTVYRLEYQECRDLIDSMRFSETSNVFGVEKEKGKLEGIISAIYQSAFEEDVYPSIEEKASNFLYFLIIAVNSSAFVMSCIF